MNILWHIDKKKTRFVFWSKKPGHSPILIGTKERENKALWTCPYFLKSSDDAYNFSNNRNIIIDSNRLIV